MPRNRTLHLRALSSAVLAALSAPGAIHANTIVVANGTCTLRDAILSANTDGAVGGCGAGSGKDVIQVTTSLSESTLPPITTDLDIIGVGATTPVLDNINEGRSFVVGSDVGGNTLAPTVGIGNLVIANGLATGASGRDGGGGGAGLGAALLIYAGNVIIDQVTFSGNVATGGNGSTTLPSNEGIPRGGGGGGGISTFGLGGLGGYPGNGGTGGSEFGGGGGGGGYKYTNESGGSNGGGGGFSTGGAGGISFGETGATAGGFGGGGGGGAAAVAYNVQGGSGAAGGFGGGGGGGASSYGNEGDQGGAGGFGGFGGGGGGGGSGQSAAGTGGDGGFGGGGGAGGVSIPGSGAGGTAGFGGADASGTSSGAGAGLGGAIFIRTGSLDIRNSTFNNNSTNAGISQEGGARAKGGAIFAFAFLTPPNGNAQGYAASLPFVSGCNVTFSGNLADDAGGADKDNADTYGASRAGLVGDCDNVFANGFE